MSEEANEAQPEAVAVPIEWRVPDDMTAVRVNQFVVQQRPDEFVLACFEAEPPIVIGPVEDRIMQAKSWESIPAHCRARLVISPSSLRSLIDLLEDNYAKFTAGKADAEYDAEDEAHHD